MRSMQQSLKTKCSNIATLKELVKVKQVKRWLTLMMSLLLGGCVFSSEQDMSNQEYQYRYFDSSSTGYDYSTLIDENWIQSDSIESEDLYHFTSGLANLDMYILKDKSTLGLERRLSEQVNQLPEEMDEEISRIGLDPAGFDVEKTERDYYGKYKFLKQSGQYKDMQFIRVYFQTEYIIPSVTGQLVTNCCIILFDNSSSEIAEDTITTFERTIEYR